MRITRCIRNSLILHALASGVFISVIADGLPGEYLLSSRWRDLFGQYSPLTNPSYIAEEDHIAVRAAFAPVLGGAFKLWEAGGVFPLGKVQSLGFTVLGEDDGHMNAGSADASGRLVNMSQGAGNLNSFFLATYAIKPFSQTLKNLSLGANTSIAYQSNFGTPKKGVGFDAGACYSLHLGKEWGDHYLGISSLNLVAPSMTDGWTPTLFNKGEYARGLKISWHARLFENRMMGGLDFDLKDFLAAASEFNKSNMGVLDNLKNSEWGLSLRVGYWMFRSITLYGLVGLSSDYFNYLGFAAGVNLPNFNHGRDFSAIYQYNLNPESILASSHTIYVREELGMSRQERILMLRPNELYNKGRLLFEKGNYWEAYFVFAELVNEFPKFFKNDWVNYFMGRCFEELDMRKAAIDQFIRTNNKYSHSKVIPHNDLAMMRIYYRDEFDGMVEGKYEALTGPDIPDSLHYHAAYLYGESSIRHQNPDKAIGVLLSIPPNHPDYVFAQYSLAVAAYEHYNIADRAAIHLEKCIEANVTTPAQQEMVNKALVYFGFLSYEEGKLGQAVTAFRRVSKTSVYYEDALLGQGWTAAKAQQWKDCCEAGSFLTGTSKRPVLQCEGLLLQALGYYMQKDFKSAYNKAIEGDDLAPRLVNPSGDSLELQRKMYDLNRSSYDSLSTGIVETGKINDSLKSLTAMDSLHRVQQESLLKLKLFLAYSDEFNRTAFFAKTNEMSRNDLYYTAAKLKTWIVGKGLLKENENATKKQEQFNQQIEEIQKQMQEVEQKGKN